MKIMSRDFTRAEKFLILVLVLVLLGLAYYYFVDRQVRDAIASAESEAEMLQSQIDTTEERLVYLRSIQQKMDKLEEEGNLVWMPSYNNSKAEVAFLNDLLEETLNYSVSFSNVSRVGDQIRRSFTLQYTTEDFEEAIDLMYELCNGENRCIVSDVRCSISTDETTTINQSATFFETMVGGTPDSALPGGSAAVN